MHVAAVCCCDVPLLAAIASLNATAMSTELELAQASARARATSESLCAYKAVQYKFKRPNRSHSIMIAPAGRQPPGVLRIQRARRADDLLAVIICANCNRSVAPGHAAVMSLLKNLSGSR